MAESRLHEAADQLSPQTIEMHRALASLIEELEAVDWYAQRVDASADDELRGVLAHNRDEEKEHACMTLEWIRRRDPVFDTYLRRFLFRTDDIVDGEEHAEGRSAGHASDSSLGIGSLRQEQTKHTREERE